jgi:MFS family permease
MGLSPQDFGGRFWLVIAATFLGFLGMGTVLPALAPHVRYELGGSDFIVGLVIGTFSATALVSRFVSGPLADQRGRRFAFLAGLASCCAAGVAYLLPIGVSSAFLGRALQGFGEACLYTGAAAWVVEIAGVERSGQALGYLSSGIWGGISAGPMVGNYLPSFAAAAALQAVLAICAMLLLWQVKENWEPTPRNGPRQWVPGRLIFPGLAVGFVNVHFPVVAGFLVLHLATNSGAGREAFTAYAATILFSRFFLGGLPDRIAPAITFFLGLSCMAAGLIGVSLSPGRWWAVAATALVGFGFSFPWSAIASTVLRRTPANERGSVISVLSAFYDLFVGMGSLSAGMVAERFGYATVFQMAAVSLLGAGYFGWRVFRRPPVPLVKD